MGLLISLIVGALVGWLASILMRTNAQQGTLANIGVGLVGSLLGTWIFGDLLHIGSAHAAGTFSVMGLCWGVAGACVFIGLLKLVNVLR